MFWRTNERDFAHSPASSETAFENAASQFASIDIPAFRENALKELESAKRASPRAPTEQAKFIQAVPGGKHVILSATQKTKDASSAFGPTDAVRP